MSDPLFYTRGGDDGYTRLLGQGRVPKEELRMEALGAVDEVNAAFGLARSHARAPEINELIIMIQRDLYGLMAEIAATPENVERFRVINTERADWLEKQVDTVTAQVEVPREFIVPGDTREGAYFDLARTIVRRAERRVTALVHRGDLDNVELMRYLNRLSSLCFVLELRENALARPSAEAQITLAKVKKTE